MISSHGGIVWAHFLASVFTQLRLVAIWKPGRLFQILAIRLQGKALKPGTGGQMFIDSASLVLLKFSFPEKRRVPKGFIDILDFQTKTAIMDAVASFKLRSPAFDRIVWEQILSESFQWVVNHMTKYGVNKFWCKKN